MVNFVKSTRSAMTTLVSTVGIVLKRLADSNVNVWTVTRAPGVNSVTVVYPILVSTGVRVKATVISISASARKDSKESSAKIWICVSLILVKMKGNALGILADISANARVAFPEETVPRRDIVYQIHAQTTPSVSKFGPVLNMWTAVINVGARRVSPGTNVTRKISVTACLVGTEARVLTPTWATCATAVNSTAVKHVSSSTTATSPRAARTVSASPRWTHSSVSVMWATKDLGVQTWTTANPILAKETATARQTTSTTDSFATAVTDTKGRIALTSTPAIPILVPMATAPTLPGVSFVSVSPDSKGPSVRR